MEGRLFTRLAGFLASATGRRLSDCTGRMRSTGCSVFKDRTYITNGRACVAIPIGADGFPLPYKGNGDGSAFDPSAEKGLLQAAKHDPDAIGKIEVSPVVMEQVALDAVMMRQENMTSATFDVQHLIDVLESFKKLGHPNGNTITSSAKGRHTVTIKISGNDKDVGHFHSSIGSDDDIHAVIMPLVMKD